MVSCILLTALVTKYRCNFSFLESLFSYFGRVFLARRVGILTDFFFFFSVSKCFLSRASKEACKRCTLSEILNFSEYWRNTGLEVFPETSDKDVCSYVNNKSK